jgi:ABC-type Mn2+/Zn2+ transport system ATPase subunit
LRLLDIHQGKFGYLNNALISEVDFSISAGEIHVIHGPNGSGKTTFLRTILGSLRLLGGNIARSKPWCCSYLSQSVVSDASFPLTVKEVLSMGAWRTGLREDQECCDPEPEFDSLDNVIASVGMKEKKHMLFSELSGGQKQRVMLARAMLAKPTLMLLDEPTASLDESATQDVVRELESLNKRGIAMIMISHVDLPWSAKVNSWRISDNRLIREIKC